MSFTSLPAPDLPELLGAGAEGRRVSQQGKGLAEGCDGVLLHELQNSRSFIILPLGYGVVIGTP